MATIRGKYTFAYAARIPIVTFSEAVTFVSGGATWSSITLKKRDPYLSYDSTKMYSWSNGEVVQINSGYSTLDFGVVPQTVSDTFYNWISANASYTPPATFAIAVHAQNVEAAEDNPVEIGDTATLTFIAVDGCELPDLLEVFGAEYTWDKATGTLALSNPSAAVEIYIGYADAYSVASGSLIALARAIREKAGVAESLTIEDMIATIENM